MTRSSVESETASTVWSRRKVRHCLYTMLMMITSWIMDGRAINELALIKVQSASNTYYQRPQWSLEAQVWHCTRLSGCDIKSKLYIGVRQQYAHWPTKDWLQSQCNRSLQALQHLDGHPQIRYASHQPASLLRKPVTTIFSRLTKAAGIAKAMKRTYGIMRSCSRVSEKRLTVLDTIIYPTCCPTCLLNPMCRISMKSYLEIKPELVMTIKTHQFQCKINHVVSHTLMTTANVEPAVITCAPSVSGACIAHWAGDTLPSRLAIVLPSVPR